MPRPCPLALISAAVLAIRGASAEPPAPATPPPAEAASSDWDEISRKLETLRVTLEFNDTPLEDAMDFISEFSGLNIVIDGTVWERHERGSIKITLRVRDLPLGSAVRLMLPPRGLALVWRHGVLLVVPKDETDKTLVLRIYDVRDLLMDVRDFPGPEVSLEPLQGADIVPVGDEGPPQMSGEFIMETVRAHCGKETWDSIPGTAIDMHNGLLTVRQSAEVQRQIRELLGKLRENK